MKRDSETTVRPAVAPDTEPPPRATLQSTVTPAFARDP
jgi:hypothetical protein